MVYTKQIQHDARAGQSCNLDLKINEKIESRRVDDEICNKISINQALVLDRTILLDRWISLKTNDNKSISGLFEKRIITDIIFIILSIVLPMFKREKLENNALKAWQITMFFEFIGVIYFVLVIGGNI